MAPSRFLDLQEATPEAASVANARVPCNRRRCAGERGLELGEGNRQALKYIEE